ncbi:ArsR family transcriptional regulator [Methanovulcanius yangii]|uniref:ArsR family transcriptional regulator n=1 Tax=Methanovulcanius yangii TaxID=1789227 RepID=UPI003873BADB
MNDPLEIVPLIITFNNSQYKKVYDLLAKQWMTQEELCNDVGADCVDDCLAILQKGNLIEEQWRMPEPGKTPAKEYRTTYSRFRAGFQCSMEDLGDLLYVANSTDEDLREMVEKIEADVRAGMTSYNDLARKYQVSPMLVKGLAKRMPNLDVKGQGLVILGRPE